MKNFWTFNIGHLLTIVSMVGWGLTMALTVQAKLTEHDVKLAEAQAELTSLKTELKDISVTLQRIAINVAGIQGADRARNGSGQERRNEIEPMPFMLPNGQIVPPTLNGLDTHTRTSPSDPG
jgi:hypothetical protein